MASPQRENGFTGIANELLEVLIKSDFSLRELKILLCVVRYTYGFLRKEAQLSSRFLSVATGIKPNHIFVAIRQLLDKNVLLNSPGKKGCIRNYSLNKNYETWNLLYQNGTSPKSVLFNNTESGLKHSPKRVTKKETKKSFKENIVQLFPISLHPLQKHISNNLPRVNKLEKQLTLGEIEKLLKVYPEERIKEVLESMENYSKLKNYTSVYLTVGKWLKNNYKNSESKNGFTPAIEGKQQFADLYN